MIINVLANGDIKNIKPENIYQGSNDANTLYLFAPFGANVNALINFELPQTHEIKGEFMFDAPTQISSDLNMWTLKVNKVLTQYYGDVKYQIRFVSNSQVIAVARGQFKVYEGVDTNMPSQPTADVYEIILENLTNIKANLLNGWVEAQALKEYNEDFNYSLNSYVIGTIDGTPSLYASKIADNKGNPLTDTNSWERKDIVKLSPDAVAGVVQDSETIVSMVDGDKIKFELSADVTNKISKSLVVPMDAPVNTELVAIDDGNSQTMISVGSGLRIDNGVLVATGGSEGSDVYVVDSLTSQSSTDALSARQGNVLYNMIVDSGNEMNQVELNARKQLLLGAEGVLEENVYSFTVDNPQDYLEYRTNLTKFLIDLNLPIAGAIDTTKEVAITFGDTTYYVFNILKGMEHATIGDLHQVDKYNDETGYRFITEMTFFENEDVVGFAIIPTISMSDVLSLDSDQMDDYMANGGLTQGQLAVCKKVITNGYVEGAIYRYDIEYPGNYSWTQLSYSKNEIKDTIDFAEQERVKDKNILYLKDATTTLSDVTFSVNSQNQTIKINGTASGRGEGKLCSLMPMTLKAGKTYMFSSKYISGDIGRIVYCDLYSGGQIVKSGTLISSHLASPQFTITFQEDTVVDGLGVSFMGGGYESNTYTNLLFNVQIEEGNVGTEWEFPYGEILHKGSEVGAFAESERQKSKNLLIAPYKSGSKTENGLTFTANEDGSIHIQGTASATTYYTFVASPNFVHLENKEYSFSVRDINGDIVSSIRLELWENGNQSTLKNGYGYITDTFVEADYNDIYMGIPKNTIIDTTIYPQLELGDISDWQSYNGEIAHKKDIQRNIVTGFLSANFTPSTTDTYENLPLTNYCVVGSALNFSDGVLTIGAGISKIRINANVISQTNDNSGETHIGIGLNNKTTSIGNASIHLTQYNATTNGRTTLSITDFIVSVSEGDVIALRYKSSSTSNTVLGSNHPRAYMTVEVVE